MVTLINKRNLAAEFSWSPIIEPEGTSFTIRPAKGTAVLLGEGGGGGDVKLDFH